MSSRWLLIPFLVLSLSSIAFSQKLINGFTREFAIQGLPAGFSLKSFDVTGDSVSELFVLTGSQLWVFDGKTFSRIFKDSAAPGTANLSPADVNRDGSMDLVAAIADTGVVVWYGPDFSTQRASLRAPVADFSSFGVRNDQSGNIEFLFGFGYEKCDSLWSCINPPGLECNINGYVLRYVDTTFVFSDSTHLNSGISNISTVETMENGLEQFLLIEYDYYFRDCMPSNNGYTITAQRFDTITSNIAAFGVAAAPSAPCGIPVLKTVNVGNIDSDTAKEFLWFVAKENQYAYYCSSKWEFKAFDLVAGVNQWMRTDSLAILALFTVDLNGDGIQELLSFEIQNANQGLGEYRTSDGTSLGFSELPFTPSTLLIGLFGDPPAPKVLLGHGDSLVVYRIGCAANKGDLNADGNVTVFDVTLELNCAFLGEGNCDLCFADVNCDGVLSPADVVWELIAVYLQWLFPC